MQRVPSSRPRVASPLRGFRRAGQDPVDHVAGDPPGDPARHLDGPAGPDWRAAHLRAVPWFADNPFLLLGAIVAEHVVGAVRRRRRGRAAPRG